MARKKSAAKKAREAESKLKDQATVTSEDLTPKKEVKPNNDLELISEDEESSSSEEEDEYGELITEKIDADINKVLETIKNDPTKLLDKDVKFFQEEDNANGKVGKKEKPMYLKDYHRMNLLSGDFKDDDNENEYGTVDGEKPYVVEQREERDQLLSDIKNAFHDEEEDDDDDDFLRKKDKPETVEPKVRLPDPTKNEDEFLKSFVDSKAWIPTKNDKIINLDKNGEDDDEFEEAVEDFENAYNFRYEDPKSAEIVSYARTQATLRRDKSNSRKRQREKKHEEKQLKLKEKEEKIKKKEINKLNKAIDRLNQIKEAVGGDIKDEVIQKVFGDFLLNDDFDDADWDSKMAEIFNEQYYDEEVTKPEFSDIEMDNQEQYDDDVEAVAEEEESEEPPKKKSKKDKLSEKKAAKKEKKSIKEKAKAIIEANKTKIVEEVEEEERGRSQEEDVKFKYREVSPETYGLTTRDILIADDKQLNSYIGIKKFAPYRPKELRVKDRRKYKKKRPLEEWRKEVFKNYTPKDNEEDDKIIWVPESDSTEKESKHKHKHQHNHKHNHKSKK